jgi:carbon-monoxide dehydrogenase small subunit
MKTVLTCTVNGTEHTVLADTRDTLLELLRDRIGLTGTKEGCGNGNCGTCTVLMDGATVNACLILAHEAPGRDIVTIEGLSDGGRMHPIQEALVAYGGTQCGFCTPGMILASVALLEKTPNPTPEQVRHGLEGNLCRCTGYQNIVRAVCGAASAMGARS